MGNEKLNMDEIHIDATFKDTRYNNVLVTITDKTSNSIEVFHTKVTKHGINCKNWYTIEEFNKRFKIK